MTKRTLIISFLTPLTSPIAFMVVNSANVSFSLFLRGSGNLPLWFAYLGLIISFLVPSGLTYLLVREKKVLAVGLTFFLTVIIYALISFLVPPLAFKLE